MLVVMLFKSLLGKKNRKILEPVGNYHCISRVSFNYCIYIYIHVYIYIYIYIYKIYIIGNGIVKAI